MSKTLLFAGVLALVAAPAYADPVVIAGSDNPPISPPTFWTDSFMGLSSAVDQAFPFTVAEGGPYWLEELEVPLYHYGSGSTAEFSVYLDDGGLPGTEIATFDVQGITTTQQIVTATLLEDVTLDSGTDYWIVGSTTEQQVNWNVGDGVYGPHAYRVNEGDWVYVGGGNVCGFTLLGTPVPEPATLSLLALGGLLAIRRRR